MDKCPECGGENTSLVCDDCLMKSIAAMKELVARRFAKLKAENDRLRNKLQTTLNSTGEGAQFNPPLDLDPPDGKEAEWALLQLAAMCGVERKHGTWQELADAILEAMHCNVVSA